MGHSTPNAAQNKYVDMFRLCVILGNHIYGFIKAVILTIFEFFDLYPIFCSDHA